MALTQHARVRQQQRGIPTFIIDLLLDFGTVERAEKGATTHYFDKASRRRVKAYLGQLAKPIEEYLDYYAIVGGDGNIITVAPRIKKIHH